MDNAFILELASLNPQMTDVDRLVNLYWALSSVLVAEVPGAVVELGCNAGKTSTLLQMVIDEFDPTRELHVYDSFQGLPKPSHRDAYLAQGDCRASVDEVLSEFRARGLRPPRIHAGWFDESLPRSCPDRIAFAYCDSDFYTSISTSLQYVYPRLAKNAIVIVDDYCDITRSPRAWPGLPGVKQACDEFIAGKRERFCVLVGTGDLAFGMLRKM